MIEVLRDLPDNVLGVRVAGEISGDEYREVLVPALEAKLAQHPRVRLLYVTLGERLEYSAGAAWEDTKVGMFHLTAFERVAVVTDVDWMEKTVKAFGFAMPGEVRVFDEDELQAAREWICEPLPTGELSFEILEESGILILRPHGELQAGDFDRLGRAIDPHIEASGGLSGLMVETESFPGWDDFSALIAHLRFVKDHQAKIRKIALVSDGRFFAMMPTLASRFLAAEVRRFAAEERDEALVWLAQP